MTTARDMTEEIRAIADTLAKDILEHASPDGTAKKSDVAYAKQLIAPAIAAALSERERAVVERTRGVVDAAREMSKDWTAFQAAFLHMRDEYGERNLPETQQRIDRAFERLEKFIAAVANIRADAARRESE